MDDRELLERAAKAVGIELEGDLHGNPGEWHPMYYEGKTYHSWDSLASDGDAFRIAVKLGFIVVVDEEMEWVGIHFSGKLGKYDWIEKFGKCRFAAARRAITCAAAESACEKAK